MKKLTVLALLLLLCGCGDSADMVVINPGPDSGPVISPLVINKDNALKVAFAVSQLTVPSGRHSVDAAGGNLTNIEIDGIAAALVELPLAFEILDKSPSRSFPGAQGGTAALTVNGTDISIVFSSFVTQDRTTLDGTVLMNGRVHDGSIDVLVTFKALQLADAKGRFQIDGPVTLLETRASGGQERVERHLDATVTDLSNGGTAEFLHHLSDSDIVTANGVETGSSENQGTLRFRNYRGLDGLVDEIPVIPYVFTVDESTEISTVLSGINLLRGDGEIRTRIIQPNIFEIAVRVTGTPEYEVLGINDISDVDQTP